MIYNGDIDAVYIPLPNSLHAKWIACALDNNINVLVEKSLACKLDEVIDLNNSAKNKNLTLVENFQFRFHKQLEIIKNIINSGEIGEIRSIHSEFGFPPFSDENNIRYNQNLGGGALLDAGAYPIKISQILLGYDLEVKAANLYIDKNKGVDIWGGGFISHKKSAAFSEISFGFDNYYQCSIEIWGSKGRIFTNRIFTAPSNLEVEINVEVQGNKKIIKVPHDNHFKNMLKYFYGLINGSNSNEEEYDQNISQARLINEFKNKII